MISLVTKHIQRFLDFMKLKVPLAGDIVGGTQRSTVGKYLNLLIFHCWMMDFYDISVIPHHSLASIHSGIN